MVVRRVTVLDIPDIINILSNTYNNLEGMELQLSLLLRVPNYYTLYIDEDKSTFIQVDRIGSYKAQFHVYTSKGSGGKRLKRMMKDIIKDVLKDHNYTCLLAFVPSDNMAGRIMATVGGMTKIGEVIDAAGSGNKESLYSISIGGN